MRSIPSRFVPVIAAVCVATAACFAAATVVQAQTPPGPRDEMRGPMARGGPGMRMMREVERLKTSLQLTPQQTALWDRAATAMKPQGDLRAEMKSRHDRMAAMLDDPNFDPRKMAAETDRLHAERRAKMNTVRDAWFAVYDSLNPVQRGQVREFLREKMSRHEHGMRGEMEWKHRDGEHRAPPAPPVPPAPAR